MATLGSGQSPPQALSGAICDLIFYHGEHREHGAGFARNPG